MSDLDKPRLALYGALALIVCFLGARYLRGQESAPAGGGGAAAQATATQATTAQAGGGAGGGGDGGVSIERASGRVTVHVAGAVRRPGLYRLPSGARVDDALRRAGGAKPGADLDAVNLAAKLEDGRQVLVPRRAVTGATGRAGAPGAARAPGSGGAAPGPLVNLNSATLEQLDTLDGVGPGIAQRILDYREQHGGFGSIDELGEVPGIGDKRLAALREKVTV